MSDRYFVVRHKGSIQYLSTAWTDEELKNSGFEPISEHPSKEVAAIMCKYEIHQEGNKLIAEFMNWRDGEGNPYAKIELPQMKYHSSLDWLMPVVEKIEDRFCKYVCTRITHPNERTESEGLKYNALIMFPNTVKSTKNSQGATRLEATYPAVVELIKWYNKQDI